MHHYVNEGAVNEFLKEAFLN